MVDLGAFNLKPRVPVLLITVCSSASLSPGWHTGRSIRGARGPSSRAHPSQTTGEANTGPWSIITGRGQSLSTGTAHRGGRLPLAETRSLSTLEAAQRELEQSGTQADIVGRETYVLLLTLRLRPIMNSLPCQVREY